MNIYKLYPLLLHYLDVNDNKPIFEKSFYSIRVLESIPTGTTILTFLALDPDEGANGEVEYTLSKMSKNVYGSKLAVDRKKGTLYVVGFLDREHVPVYHLTVVAKDRGADSLSSEVSATVYVDDVNDNPPLITVSTVSADRLEDVYPGTFLAHITVQDPDDGNNAKTTCSL
ncbi:hypothetical protein HELRODRAFT_65606, partial [Helobdella robusta]|uniref:Cadherin domain-containing protein n=1 Tax=Helobdella robusta TaxID=6412 RepID=T1FYA5_HELRO